MDVSPIHIPKCCHLCEKLHHAFSFKRCCLFLLLLLLLAVAIVGATVLAVVVILKPRKPIFSLQRVVLDSYELQLGDGLCVSAAISINWMAQNPNKVGLIFMASQLSIYHQGLMVGVIRVPGFYQPVHSRNVSVHTRVLLDSVNVSKLILGGNSKEVSLQIRLLGDFRLHVRAFRVTLPEIKVALDCDINIPYGDPKSINAVYDAIKALRNHKVSIPTNFEKLSPSCSLALYI